jgi:hypothetical protein
MAKAVANNKMVLAGTKFSGRHKKDYGPKESRPKKYKGQGR